MAEKMRRVEEDKAIHAASFSSCYITLLKTSIGSGVLSFLFLFKTYGIATATISTVVSGTFAVIGLVLYVLCAHEIGRSATLSELALVRMPYTKIMVDFSVFLKCFGVALSYLIIARKLLPPYIETVFGRAHIVNPNILLVLFLAFVGPFCYFQKLDKLKYISFCGILAIFFVIIATIYRYYYISIIYTCSVYFITPISTDYLGGFGKFVFSFTCHQNIFAVHSEMANNSVKRTNRLILAVATSALVMYITFGLFNYLLYGVAANTNIIRNYPNDVLASIVRGLYIVVVGVSYSLQVNPCRAYFVKMISYDKQRGKAVVNICVTTLIIVLTYCIAVSGMNLGIVYTIVGATASTFIRLIFPSLFYFNMDINRSVMLDILSYLSFLLGVFVFLAAILNVGRKYL
nr:LOW QUALITY PROTEIN: vacuolar amino acid transporter 5-like [Megalopta genalis]